MSLASVLFVIVDSGLARVVWIDTCLDHGQPFVVLQNQTDKVFCRPGQDTESHENPDAVVIDCPQDTVPECRAIGFLG